MRSARAILRYLFLRLRWGLLLLVPVSLLVANLLAWREYEAAEAAWRADQSGRALGHINNCLTVWRWSRAAHLLAARIARTAEQYPLAEGYLKDYKRLGGTDEKVQLEWLLMRAQSGEVDELAPGLLRAAEADPEDRSLILTALAQAYMARLRYAAALGLLNRLLETSPDDVRALDWKGWVLQRLIRDEEAMAVYSRVLELDPERDGVRKRLVGMYLAANDPTPVRPHLEYLLKKSPDSEGLLMDWASMSLLTGDLEEAERTQNRILAMNPDLPGVLIQRAKVALGKNQPADAEEFLRRAEKINPEDPEVHYSLYRALAAQRNPEASEYLKRFQLKERDLRRLTTLLGEKGERLRQDPAEATEAGRLLFGAGADKAAVYWLHAALDKDPAYKPAHAELARYYERINDPDIAAEHRRRAEGLPRAAGRALTSPKPRPRPLSGGPGSPDNNPAPTRRDRDRP